MADTPNPTKKFSRQTYTAAIGTPGTPSASMNPKRLAKTPQP